jgi:hypothetical protein
MTNKRTLTGVSRIVAIAVLGTLLNAVAADSARTRDLSVEDARRLVLQALEPTQRTLPGLVLKPSPGAQIPDFYRFEVYWDNPTPGSVVVGNFAVNRATGDVWELFFCKKRSSAELRRLQKDLRKAIGLSPDELRKLTDKAPCE